MRYQSKSSISYMFRNFWNLVYITLPVSVLMAFFYNPSSEITLFTRLVNNEIAMDEAIYMLGEGLTALRFGRFWWVVPIAIVVLAYAMSVMVVKIDRHMRVGQMPAFPLKRAFGIFPFMLLYIICSVAAMEIFMLIIVGIAYMLRFINNATAVVSVAFGLSVVVRVFWIYLLGLLIISLPLKYSENYRFNVALSYSARTMTRKNSKLWGLALLVVVLRVAVMGIAYLLAPYKLDALIYAVGYTFGFTFAPCFAFKHYYDDVGGERRDVTQIMFG